MEENSNQQGEVWKHLAIIEECVSKHQDDPACKNAQESVEALKNIFRGTDERAEWLARTYWSIIPRCGGPGSMAK